MLYSVAAITNLQVRSSDGAYGDIKDVYFDDVAWMIRYLVVDIGSWRADRLVLLSPQAIEGLREDKNAFLTHLTRRQIMDSPPMLSSTELSRQHEESLNTYYGWEPYWVTPLTQGVNLLSFHEAKSYGLRALDGEMGELDDLMLDARSWRIMQLIVDIRKWWPGGQIVIDRSLVSKIDWAERKILLAMTQDEMKQAPAFESQGQAETEHQPLSRYLEALGVRGPSILHTGTTKGFEPWTTF